MELIADFFFFAPIFSFQLEGPEPHMRRIPQLTELNIWLWSAINRKYKLLKRASQI